MFLILIIFFYYGISLWNCFFKNIKTSYSGYNRVKTSLHMLVLKGSSFWFLYSEGKRRSEGGSLLTDSSSPLLQVAWMWTESTGGPREPWELTETSTASLLACFLLQPGCGVSSRLHTSTECCSHRMWFQHISHISSA